MEVGNLAAVRWEVRLGELVAKTEATVRTGYAREDTLVPLERPRQPHISR